MIKNDIAVMLQWYERFIESVKQIAMSAEEQTTKLSGFVVADEIASDFSDWNVLCKKAVRV